MYTQFYGLREKPFSLSPDPRYLFLADSHREALAHLLYGIEQGEGFIAITGEVGTGKTTLCRTLLQRLEPGTEVAFIFNPQLSALELLQAISAELGLETGDRTRRELTDQLNRFLLAKRQEDRRVLLIIDEAQNLAPDALEQVRLLSNLETNETREYVRHRLRIAAGAPRDLFTELALREVHRRSQGIPRLVNLLCDRALLAGYAASAKSIGLGLVTQTEKELRGGVRSLPGPVARSRLDRLLPPSLRRVVPATALVGIGVLAGVAWQSLSREPGVEATSPPQVSAAPPGRAEWSPPPEAGPERALAGALVAGEEGLAGQGAPAPSPTLGSLESATPFESVAATTRMAAIPPPLDRPELATVLARSSPAVTTAASLNALLAIWGEAPTEEELMPLAEALAILEGRGLSILRLRGASLATLRLLNYPAILELSALDGMPRFALLTGLSGSDAWLVGIDERRSLRVPLEQVEEHWDGEAWLAWRDFEELPEILRPPQRGAPVRWLQETLGHLGFYDEVPTGEFDAATVAAVRALQASLEVEVDGTVGQMTKMRLYETLGRYDLPRLSRRDEETG